MHESWKLTRNATAREQTEKKLIAYAERIKERLAELPEEEQVEKGQTPTPKKPKTKKKAIPDKSQSNYTRFEIMSLDLLTRISSQLEDMKEVKELLEISCNAIADEVIPLLRALNDNILVSR